MLREFVLFEEIENNPIKNKEFMEAVSNIFNLEILFYNDEYILIQKNYYKKALESKIKGERVFGRVGLTNHSIIDRFNPKLVQVTKKFYPLFISNISISYGDKYRISNFGNGEEIEIFDSNEWTEY